MITVSHRRYSFGIDGHRFALGTLIHFESRIAATFQPYSPVLGPSGMADNPRTPAGKRLSRKALAPERRVDSPTGPPLRTEALS